MLNGRIQRRAIYIFLFILQYKNYVIIQSQLIITELIKQTTARRTTTQPRVGAVLYHQSKRTCARR